MRGRSSMAVVLTLEEARPRRAPPDAPARAVGADRAARAPPAVAPRGCSATTTATAEAAGTGRPGSPTCGAGRATLVLDRKWTSHGDSASPGGGAYAGAHVEVVGWHVVPVQPPRPTEHCAGQGADVRQMGTAGAARRPTAGATWCGAGPILAPTPGTPWACAATDGDAVYDADARTSGATCSSASTTTAAWQRLLRRAARRRARWAVRAGRPRARTPSSRPGGCGTASATTPADQCKRAAGQPPIADEGTFNVFPRRRRRLVGRRSTATTARTASAASRAPRRSGRTTGQVDGEDGTPTDAILDAARRRRLARALACRRADRRRRGEHARAGRLVLPARRGPRHEPRVHARARTGISACSARATLVEHRPGSNTRRATRSSTRAGRPRRPGRPRSCNVEYPSLFRRPGDRVTLPHVRPRVADPGYDGHLRLPARVGPQPARQRRLPARGPPSGWSALARRGRRSSRSSARRTRRPTARPYLAFNCGAAACDGDEGIYQDVQVRPEDCGRRRSRSAARSAPRAAPARLELDASCSSTPSGRDRPVDQVRRRGRRRLRPCPRHVRARRRARGALRLQLTPRTPGTLRADNLYLIPQEGCDGARYPAC